MDSNKLKKLSRKDILELLLEQIKENEELKKELLKAQKELSRRKLVVEKKGSLAEASLEMVEIFKKADEAAEIYLENIRNQKG